MRGDKEDTVDSYKVTSIGDFIEQVTQFAKDGNSLKCYRGQRDKAWKNVPGLLRNDRKGLEANEKRATRDLIAVYPDEFSADQTMFDRLVRMQHFGLPTRLLDVSLNPLVALYFATDPGLENVQTDGVVTAFNVPAIREKYYDSDAVSCIANLANLEKDEKKSIIDLTIAAYKDKSKGDNVIKKCNLMVNYKKLHQFIRAEKSYFLPKIKPIDLFSPYYVHPKMSNRRVMAQAGGFIIYGLHSAMNGTYREKIQETRFIVLKSEKETIRKSLKLLGITDSTLFPELDRAAMRITEKYSTPPH